MLKFAVITLLTYIFYILIDILYLSYTIVAVTHRRQLIENSGFCSPIRLAPFVLDNVKIIYILHRTTPFRSKLFFLHIQSYSVVTMCIAPVYIHVI